MFVIRTVTENDRDIIVDMMKDFYQSPACLHPVPEENFHRTIDQCIAGNPGARTVILEEQEEGAQPVTMGYANFSVSWNNEAGGIQIWFDELYMKDAARGKGYGTRVFQWLEEEYPGLKRIRLEVTKENVRAISLYERLGYESLLYYQMYKDFE